MENHYILLPEDDKNYSAENLKALIKHRYTTKEAALLDAHALEAFGKTPFLVYNLTLGEIAEPETYCKAKYEENNPGFPECGCYNFCKYDGIQFDSILS